MKFQSLGRPFACLTYIAMAYGKSPFFYGETHYKWPFSMAMLNYQRVYTPDLRFSCGMLMMLFSSIETFRDHAIEINRRSYWRHGETISAAGGRFHASPIEEMMLMMMIRTFLGINRNPVLQVTFRRSLPALVTGR